jgi:hypothetical protein
MRTLIAFWLTAIIAAGSGAPFAVAQLVVHPEEFDRAMKTIGTAMAGVNQSIGAKAYVDAKTPLALSRQTLASTRPWWVKHQEPDAARMTRAAVEKLDALDKALSAAAVNAAAVDAAVQDVNRACEACHAVYREGDERTGYRIKARLGTP